MSSFQELVLLKKTHIGRDFFARKLPALEFKTRFGRFFVKQLNNYPSWRFFKSRHFLSFHFCLEL